MTTTNVKAPALLPASDQRTVRDILLDIEKKMARPAAQAPEPKAKTMTFPSRLSDKAREAIKVVLDDARQRGVTLPFDRLIDHANAVEPACLYKCGTTNDSIRAFCAELCGIEQRWSN